MPSKLPFVLTFRQRSGTLTSEADLASNRNYADALQLALFDLGDQSER